MTTIAFFAPLIYTTNREIIDSTVKQATDVVNAQTAQLREVASKHTAQATNITKQYMGDYTAKAQQMLRGRSASPERAPAKSEPVVFPPVKAEPVKSFDFPAVPTKEPSQAPDIVKEDKSFQPADPVKTEDPMITS